MPDQFPRNFHAYRDTYCEAIEKSIAFARTDLDFFTRAKARALRNARRRGRGARS